MRTKAENTIRIDGEKLRTELTKSGFSLMNISSMILRKEKSYLSSCLRIGRINSEAYSQLCTMFNLNKDDYIEKAAPAEIKENVSKAENSSELSVLTGKLDTLISTVAGLGKAIETLTAVEIASQKRLDAIETEMKKTAKNTGDIIEELKIDLDSLDDGIGKINSNLNYIKGQIREIVGSDENNVVKMRA